MSDKYFGYKREQISGFFESVVDHPIGDEFTCSPDFMRATAVYVNELRDEVADLEEEISYKQQCADFNTYGDK